MLEHEGRQVADAIGASARFEPLDVTKEEDWAAAVAPTAAFPRAGRAENRVCMILRWREMDSNFRSLRGSVSSEIEQGSKETAEGQG